MNTPMNASSISRPKILFLHGLDPKLADLVMSAAPSAFDVIALSGKAPQSEQVAMAREADFMMIYRAPITPALIQSATRVQLVQLLAAGYDGIDIGLLKEPGIPCANNGGANSWAVADQAVLLMLSLYRRVIDTDRETREGKWQSGVTGLNTFEMAGKLVGIFGLGNIGQKVAKRVQGFECRVQYYSRHRLSEAEERALDVTYVSLDELFTTSDIISLHAPLTDDTHHLIDAKRIRSMKRNAIIINTSRGAMIDEPALFEALKSRVIAGAGLDAFTEEPVKMDNPLLTLDNVILAPHTGGTTSDTWVRRGKFGFDNIARVIRGERPLALVNGIDRREQVIK